MIAPSSLSAEHGSIFECTKPTENTALIEKANKSKEKLDKTNSSDLTKYNGHHAMLKQRGNDTEDRSSPNQLSGNTLSPKLKKVRILFNA